MSRVAPDSRDASKDYWIPTAQAQALFREGKLFVDGTNSQHERVYCHPDNVPHYIKIS